MCYDLVNSRPGIDHGVSQGAIMGSSSWQAVMPFALETRVPDNESWLP